MRTKRPRQVSATGRRSRWRRARLGVVLSAALIASACGSDETSPAVGARDADAPASDSTSDADSAPDAAGEASVSVPQGEVTIGDETYTFSQEGFAASSNCSPSRLGAFRALLLLVDEDGELTVRSDLDLVLVHDPDSLDRPETDMIRVRLGHLEDRLGLDATPGWYADAAHAEEYTGLAPGTSQVDSYEIDGNTVSGTATFVDFESDTAFFKGEIDSVESVAGTFTVTCASP